MRTLYILLTVFALAISGIAQTVQPTHEDACPVGTQILSSAWDTSASPAQLRDLECLQIPSGKLQLQNAQAQSIEQVRYADSYPGSDIGAKVNAAFASCTNGCDVVIPAGTYSFSTTIDVGINDYLRGQGAAVTIIDYTGTGDAILVEAGSLAPYRSGAVRKLTLNGSSASSTANGIHQVNTVGFTYHDLSIESFGGTGLWIDNEDTNYCANCGNGFNERTQISYVSLFQNGTNLAFTREGTTSTPSYEYTWIRGLHIQINGGETGLLVSGTGATESGALQHSDVSFMANVCISNGGAEPSIVNVTNGGAIYEGKIYSAAENSCSGNAYYWSVGSSGVIDDSGSYNDLTTPSLTNNLASGSIFIIGQPQTCVDGQNTDGQSGKGNADCSASLFPLTLYGNADSGWAGYGDITLAGSWGSSGQLNESLQFSGGGSATAGFGEDYGSSIQHPIAWAYIGDPVAFGWYDKTNSSTPISGSPGAFLTGNGGDSPYGSWDWVGAGFCFSGNSTCLSEPSSSGTVALSGANGISAGLITMSGGAGSHTFATAYTTTAQPACTANDTTTVAAVKTSVVGSAGDWTGIDVAGTTTDVVAWQCAPQAN